MKRELYEVEVVDRETRGIKYGSILVILFLGIFIALPLFGAERPHSSNLVVIDPAHGGEDAGVKLSGSQYEKDVTLKIALALEKELRVGKNIPVLLTRMADRNVPLAERLKLIHAAGARMLISIHVNAGFGRQAGGYEVYFPGFHNHPAGKNGAAEIIDDMVGNKHLNESVALAQDILRNLQEVFPHEERGLREAPLPLLEGLALPAAVVEVGFATNPEDKKIITADQGQKAIARALNKSIREFLHLN